MKLLLLTALLVAVASGRPDANQAENPQKWPWQSGKLYRYDVESRTLARLQEGPSSGSAFKARFVVHLKSPGWLQAKLENPQHAQVHEELPKNRKLPSDLKYQPIPNLDQPFEIAVDGGRVQYLSFPTTLSLPHENLLKGLIGALQVDLSPNHNIHGSQDNYDKETQQGLFRKMEKDVTGDCETLYAVSPVASEWRRELPKFAAEEDPIEITKSKNYGHCHHRVAYHFGVPVGAEWTGTAHKNSEEQFIRRATVSRILAAKEGKIYKSETTSTVYVHPHMYGKQKAEVYSHVELKLDSLEPDNEEEWQMPESSRLVKNLLYSMSAKQMAHHDKSSSSSSSSSESDEHDHVKYSPVKEAKRTRRSAKSPKVVAISKVIVKRDDKSTDSTSSSSSSDSSSAYVNDEIPNINEPAYAALYMSSQPHADKKQNTMNAQKLLQDIAQQLQNPNNMPKADALSKFNILVRLIAAMSTEQLSQTSRSIEIAKSSNNMVKADMWMVYRDAVAQAGTLPAFQQIKTWIESKKIQGEEAAEVVTTLAKTLRYPTKEVMSQFFKLAVSEEVSKQKFLHTAALIAATKLINMGQVNNDTAHSYYPTHMYGRLARKHDNFVQEEVLPRLSKELKEAIERDDSTEAQVYIKAIGNIGHHEILKVFAPYLEGQVPVSTYLRVHMVSNMRTLAQQKDKHARAVLFSILRNTAEPYEVRVTAINNIFLAHPTGAMMQAMAQMSHDDPSVQVRAFIKSSIESAAKLKNYRRLDLSRAADAAESMLTKEKFGYQQSINEFNDHFEKEYDHGIFSGVSHIGSEDSVIPKHLRVILKSKKEGWKKENTILASVSSVKQFVDYLKDTMYESQPKSQSAHKYPAEKISEMLNIKRDIPHPLEASIFINLVNQQRFFTFSEKDLKQLPKDIKEYMSEVEKGVEKHYTKILNQAQVSVMFPVAMGVPFIYKYKEPTVVHIQSKAKGEIKSPSKENRDFSMKMDKEIQFTYARNIDGSAGFLDTLSNHHAKVGVVNKLQVNIPVKLKVEKKSGEVKLKVEPLRPDQETTLLHHSVWPYSANQKKDSLVPISQDPTTKVIERKKKVVSTDTKVGQNIGMTFHLQGHSYSSDYQSFGNMFQSKHLLSNIAYIFSQRDVAQTHFNFKHLGKPSQNKAATFHAKYDKLHNQKHDGEIGEATEMKDVTPDSEARRQEMVKRAAAGIKTARVQIVDLSAVFEGSEKTEYVVTGVLGDSPVDAKTQYALFAGSNSPHGKSQINAVGKVERPEITTLNFLQALEKDIKAKIHHDIKYGQNSHIQIEGKAERSKKNTEELQEHPMAKECAKEIARNNKYQPACQKMIVMAHAPDHLELSVTYKNVAPKVMNSTHHMYKLIQHLGFWNSDDNPLKSLPEGKVEIKAEASYPENMVNWSVTSKYGHMHVKNVPIPKATADALAFYAPLKAHERVQNHYSRQQFHPHCTVDGSKINTFSDRSYDYTLSRSWHVVMQDEAKPESRHGSDVVILARKPSEDKQEVYISYKSETGKDMEVEIKPAPEGSQKHDVKVKTNGKKVSEGDLNMYWDDVADEHLLQHYTQPDGVMVLTIGDDRLRVMYDGQRTVVIADDHRNTARGICGRMSGEPRDDYETPNGLVDKPEHYAASYALNDENSDPKTQELQVKAKQAAYKPKNKYTAILRSDIEWQNAMESSEEEDWGGQNVYKARSYLKERGPCELQQQVQYYENHGEICITTAPMPACQSHCRGEDYKVQATQVTCRPKLDQQYRTYKDQIRQGQNPKVTGVPQLKQYKVPSSCKA